MRYTRGVRYKERQRGQLEELVTDTISSKRDIPLEWNRAAMGDSATKGPDFRLSAETDERWEVVEKKGRRR